MEPKKLLVCAGPHITSGASTRKIMLGVCLALLPTLLASSLIFGWQVLFLSAVCVSFCVSFELAFTTVLKRPASIGDFSAVVTGLLLAFCLPPSFPIWMAGVGCFVSIVVVKQLFGGIGFNFANPAIVGRIVLQTSFTQNIIATTPPQRTFAGVDALAGATPLLSDGQNLPLIDLFLGTHAGTLGETCALTLLLGGLFLLFTRIIRPAIPLAYLGGVFGLKFALLLLGSARTKGFWASLPNLGSFAREAGVYLLCGGLLLAAFFMATDYTTSPYTLLGQVVFALGLAFFTVCIREWGTMPEGVSFAILLMNLLVPYINAFSRRRPHGVGRFGRKKTGKGAA